MFVNLFQNQAFTENYLTTISWFEQVRRSKYYLNYAHTEREVVSERKNELVNNWSWQILVVLFVSSSHGHRCTIMMYRKCTNYMDINTGERYVQEALRKK